MVLGRTKDDILNDLHSAQGKFDFWEMINLKKELDIFNIKWILQQNKQDIINLEEESEIQELKKIINRSVKQEVKNYMEGMTGIVIDKKIIDDNLVALISVLQDILNNNPKKKIR